MRIAASSHGALAIPHAHPVPNRFQMAFFERFASRPSKTAVLRAVIHGAALRGVGQNAPPSGANWSDSHQGGGANRTSPGGLETRRSDRRTAGWQPAATAPAGLATNLEHAHGEPAVGDPGVAAAVHALTLRMEAVHPVVAVERTLPRRVAHELVAFVIHLR